MRSENERRKMKWPLISNRSSQQREKSQQIPGGETLQEHSNHARATVSAALNITPPDSRCIPIPKQMNILLILTLIGLIFWFIPPELGDFNNEIIDLNSEFKLEKMVLNNDCGVSSSPTNNNWYYIYTSI